jgi:putative copper resistance protein D
MLDALAAANKALLYASLLSCCGVVLSLATLRSVATPRLAGFGQLCMRRTAWATMALSACGALLLFFQLGGDYDDPTLLGVFWSGRGAAFCLQFVGAALLLAMPVDDDPLSGIRISNAALLPASLAISGHAISGGLLNGLVLLAHAAAASWWIGSLLLMRYAWMNETSGQFGSIVAAFSLLALRIVGALVGAGVLLVVILVDFRADPFWSSYVRWLALKVLLAAIVLGLALDNRRRLTPRVTAGDEATAAALCRRVDVELAVIAALLLVTAILTSYTSPD